jgi:hypothetical protein
MIFDSREFPSLGTAAARAAEQKMPRYQFVVAPSATILDSLCTPSRRRATSLSVKDAGR